MRHDGLMTGRPLWEVFAAEDTMTETSVFVPGIPRPQGSKRHVGNGVMVESSRHVKAWRAAVTLVARAHLSRIGWVTPAGPVAVSLTFLLPRPQRPRDPLPITPPDIDKLARAALDGLTLAGAFADDKQVTDLAVIKRYAGAAGPGLLVRLAEPPQDQPRP